MTREIILDTETTGLNPIDGHKIIEIAAVELIDNIKTNNYFHSYINPERGIPESSQKIHNISDEMIKNKPIFKEVMNDFLNFIKDDTLIIHNADFDLKFLNYELNLNKICNLKNRIIDTLTLARSKYPGSSVSLDSLCKKFNINVEERIEKGHGALIDCYLLSEVYLEILGGKQPDLILNRNNKRIQTKASTQKTNNFFRKKELKLRLNELIIKKHKEFIENIKCNDIWSVSHKKISSKLKENYKKRSF